jgi:SNF2 family DNA or RNA helicase
MVSPASFFEIPVCLKSFFQSLDYWLLFTETPIANAMQELFELLKFANPSTFGTRVDFW